LVARTVDKLHELKQQLAMSKANVDIYIADLCVQKQWFLLLHHHFQIN